MKKKLVKHAYFAANIIFVVCENNQRTVFSFEKKNLNSIIFAEFIGR